MQVFQNCARMLLNCNHGAKVIAGDHFAEQPSSV